MQNEVLGLRGGWLTSSSSCLYFLGSFWGHSATHVSCVMRLGRSRSVHGG